MKKNNEITSKTLRVLSESGEYLGVFSLSESLDMARKQNLDLVQTNTQDVPVCMLIDYGKYLYNQKKKDKETKQKIIDIKEVHIRYNTGTHDLQIKANKIKKFFSGGHKVRIVLELRGRERSFISLAKETLNEFLGIIDQYQVDQELSESVNGLIIQIKQ